MTEDFERAIHGIQNNLLFVHSSLNQLIERTTMQEACPAMFKYNIPDSIDHIKALGWQIERFVHNADLDIRDIVDVKLFGDILAKLTPIRNTMGKFFNVKLEEGNLFDHSLAKELPMIKADEEALLTVFRNLVENSVKYSKRDVKLRLIITWKVTDHSITIYVTDNGIGINKEDSRYIFAEGYKAEDAMRRSTVGAGLGLFQCKTIMEHMNGNLWLENMRSPTVFALRIPTA